MKLPIKIIEINFEAAKSTKNQSKYSLDRGNAFNSMLRRCVPR